MDEKPEMGWGECEDKYVFGKVLSLLGRMSWAGCVDFM